MIKMINTVLSVDLTTNHTNCTNIKNEIPAVDPQLRHCGRSEATHSFAALRYSTLPDTLEQNAPFIHLQWFAPEDEGRTEEPTEHKIREARKEGKVAKTSELAPALVLVFSITAIAFLSGYILNTIIGLMKYFFSISSEVHLNSNNQIASIFFINFLKIFLPIAIIAFIAALAGNLLQVGFLFTTKPITPDLNRIAPNFVRYFQKTLFSMEAVFNLGKTLFKIAVISLIVYFNLKSEANKLINLAGETLQFSLRYIAITAFKIIIEAGFFLLILSFPDYMFQRRQHRESLKMSRQELKEEMKQLEGDPLVKRMLNERMRELLSQNFSKNVPLSDVVITNPTHFAVAVMYDRSTMAAPRVNAKGQDEAALRIKQIAKDNSVPVVENKPLARALYSEVEVGDELPEKYWEAIVIILTEVYTLTGKAADYAQAGAAWGGR